MKSKVIKVAASGFVIGAALVGCTPSAQTFRPTASSDKVTSRDRQAADAQDRAAKASLKGDLAGALAAMENAVELSPRDAGYRRTLADLYLKSGRFASAEATYADVLALNPGDAKAGFFLALSQLAQGRGAAALVQLGAMDTAVAPGDLGLAYALAGDTRRAIELLEPAARESTATGRDRQNLALAYALSGDWKRARITAEQDASPTDLNKRLEQWAQMASNPAPEARIASLLDVSPATDPGQPAHLALAPAVAQPAAVESAFAAPAPVEPAAPMDVAAAQPEAVAEAPVPPVEFVEAPVAPAVSEPVFAQAIPEAPALIERSIVPTAVPAYIPTPNPTRAVGRNGGSSRFVVQIGAYRSPAQVERAWSQVYRRYAVSAALQPQSTTVRIDGKGLFHRLSIAGFDSRDSAVRTCLSIRAKGGACFVRTNAGDAPVQWASRYTLKA